MPLLHRNSSSSWDTHQPKQMHLVLQNMKMCCRLGLKRERLLQHEQCVEHKHQHSSVLDLESSPGCRHVLMKVLCFLVIVDE